MRKEFMSHLHEIMKHNENVWVLTGDLGFGLLDDIRKDYPERFINCGAAEAAMSDIAVGLALSGRIPIVYSITPFLLYRCFETWRTYVNHEQLHVILIGSGRDNDYEIDGISHDATDDILLFNHEFEGEYEYENVNGILNNFESRWPETSNQAIEELNRAIKDDKPWYINLKR